MANTLSPFGLRQYGGPWGVAPNFARQKRKIASAYGTKIFQGDPVLNVSTGYIQQWTAGSANYLFAGVFEGCEYLSVSQGRKVFSNFWPGSDASGDVDAWVTAPSNGGGLFLVQSQTTKITLANVGNNADLTMATAGSTITGISGAALDQSTVATTNTLPLKIEGLYEGVGNGSDATTSYNWVIVSINVAGQQGV